MAIARGVLRRSTGGVQRTLVLFAVTAPQGSRGNVRDMPTMKIPRVDHDER